MVAVRPKQTLSMLTRDGVRLDADVYYPDIAEPVPVLLMRQPYGRAIASTVVYAHPSWYASHGYIVVIQDVRGRGTSEGEFVLFAHEMADGYDAVEWAAALPGSSGVVGMYGFSYQGMTQLYAAVQQPPALKALCPAMLAYNLYTDWAYEGGAFCLQTNLSWAIQLATETARLRGDEDAHWTLYNVAKALPIGEMVPTRSGILKALDPTSFYHAWLEHAEPSEYWQALSPKTYEEQFLSLPMLHIGGWFDPYLRGTLNLYQAMVDRSSQRQQLIIGPWAHLPWGRKVGTVDFGAAAISPCDRLQIRWFNQFLKGIDTGLLAEPAIALFEMGSNQWLHPATWNTSQPTRAYLSSTGLASLDERDGRLSFEALPEATAAITDVLVHDPWRPVPSLGGHATIPAGMVDRASLDSRSDVLTYTSEPLTTDLHLQGAVTVRLYCTADSPSFDLCAVLSDVQSSGAVYNLTQGYRRVESGQLTQPVEISLQPTCACLHAGHALRLSLSAACFPAYPVNPGTGASLLETRLINQQIIAITVQHASDRPCHILLPTKPAN
jgi:hypothetical protein